MISIQPLPASFLSPSPWARFKRWFWRGGVDIPQGRSCATYVTNQENGWRVWIGLTHFDLYGSFPILQFSDALEGACKHIEQHPMHCSGDILVKEKGYAVIGRVSAMKLVADIRRIVGKG